MGLTIRGGGGSVDTSAFARKDGATYTGTHDFNGASVTGISGATPTDLLTPLFADNAPVYFAHRSGAGFHYQEQSIDGMGAAIRSGFIAEVDCWQLADGTWAMCHDSTVTRTMTGITGNVVDKTRAEWEAARLKPVLTNGKKERAPFWEDALNAWGGRGFIAPECKPNTSAAATSFALTITRRGLQGMTLANTFSTTNAQVLADAGLWTALISDSETPATVAGWGVKAIFASQAASQSYVESIAAAGLVPVVYGISTDAEIATRIAWGAKGIVISQPWFTTSKYEARNTDPFSEMGGWVGLKEWSGGQVVYKVRSDGRVALNLQAASTGVRAPFFGAMPRSTRILSTWKHGATGVSSSSARLYFGTTKDIHVGANEGSNDNYYVVLLRRSGNVDVYKKVGGTTTQISGAGAANPVFTAVADATAGSDQQVQVDITSAGIDVTNVATGSTRTHADTSVAGPFYLSLSTGGTTNHAEVLSVMRTDI